MPVASKADGDEDRRSGQIGQSCQHDDGDDRQEGQAFAIGGRQFGRQRRRGDKLPLRRLRARPVDAFGTAPSL